jgi:hypothetical protein
MFDNACTIVNNRLDDSQSTCEAFGSGVVKQVNKKRKEE